MKVIGYITSFLVLCTLSAVFNGFALSKLWEWFIVSTFGLPSLSVAAAIGFSIVVSFLTHQAEASSKEETFAEIFMRGLVLAILKPALALAIGAVVASFL